MKTEEHPWQSAADSFTSKTLPKLVVIGKQIGADPSENAGKIIRLYEMLRRSFDPMTLILLDEAIEQWEKANENRH